MKCRKCGAENPDDARYCRACGEALAGGNAMERLADYHFVPVSIAQLRGVPKARLAWRLLFPFLLVVTFFFVNALIWMALAHIFGWGAGLLCLVLIVKKGGLLDRSFPNRFKAAQLRKEADYIQSYKSSAEKFVFILKDDKFGVYDVEKFKVQIPPIYDELSWKEQKRLLYAAQGGRRYVIDIYGNELK